MKSLLVRAFQFISVGMLLVSPALCGPLDHRFKMQVPFDFVAANHQFSAGDYTITSDTATGTVALRSGDTGPTVVVATYSAGDNKDYARARLIFNQYGNHFFLTQVWPAGATGRGLSKSRQEVEMAKTVSRPEVLSISTGTASR